jgi:hypothetical protein
MLDPLKPDLERLEKVCPHTFQMINLIGALHDGEVTISEKTANAIAACLLELDAENERLKKENQSLNEPKKAGPGYGK